MRTALTTLGVLALTGTGVALWPLAPASAQQQGARAWINPDPLLYTTINYEAGPGEVNDVTVTNGANEREYVIDDVVPIETGRLCDHPDPADLTLVICTVSPTDEADPYLEVTLGDLDDTGDVHAQADLQGLRGGNGDDVLTGIVGRGEHDSGSIDAGPGDDRTSGSFHQNGGEGDDTLIGAEGYQTLDGDWYRDSGNDTIFGRGGDDWIDGRGGNDEVHAGGGADWVQGSEGDDTLYGETGDDELEGGPGDDQLHGGPGNDTIEQDG